MKNVICDLDGTLVDSLPGIEQSVRAAVREVLPAEPLPDLRTVIGPPLPAMFARLWPGLAPAVLERLIAGFRVHYIATGCLAAQPYPGVVETLARLHGAGLRLFVLTNKPAAPTRKILEHLDLARFFTASLSPDSVQPPLGSKADGARRLRDQFDLAPHATALVGDGAEDAAAAQACGFRFIAAAYGYGTAAASAPLRAEKFSEIEQLLL